MFNIVQLRQELVWPDRQSRYSCVRRIGQQKGASDNALCAHGVSQSKGEQALMSQRCIDPRIGAASEWWSSGGAISAFVMLSTSCGRWERIGEGGRVVRECSSTRKEGAACDRTVHVRSAGVLRGVERCA